MDKADLAGRVDIDGGQLVNEGSGARVHGIQHAALRHARKGNAQRHS